MKTARKSRAREIKELFAEHVTQGESALWPLVLAACFKAENAALYPNDPDMVREYKCWMRELRSYCERGTKASCPSNVVTPMDVIRARGLGIRLDQTTDGRT